MTGCPQCPRLAAHVRDANAYILHQDGKLRKLQETAEAARAEAKAARAETEAARATAKHQKSELAWYVDYAAQQDAHISAMHVNSWNLGYFEALRRRVEHLELELLNARGEIEATVDSLRHVGHGCSKCHDENLAELGLKLRDDDPPGADDDL